MLLLTFELYFELYFELHFELHFVYSYNHFTSFALFVVFRIDCGIWIFV